MANVGEIQEVQLPPLDGVAIRESHPIEELPTFFTGAFPELAAFMQARGATPAGPPFARYFDVGEDGADVEVVIPVAAPVEGEGRIHPVHLPAGRAVQSLHAGPYEAIMPVYHSIEQWLEENHKAPADAIREVYVHGPDETGAPKGPETLVVQPFAEA